MELGSSLDKLPAPQGSSPGRAHSGCRAPGCGALVWMSFALEDVMSVCGLKEQLSV